MSKTGRDLLNDCRTQLRNREWTALPVALFLVWIHEQMASAGYEKVDRFIRININNGLIAVVGEKFIGLRDSDDVIVHLPEYLLDDPTPAKAAKIWGLYTKLVDARRKLKDAERIVDEARVAFGSAHSACFSTANDFSISNQQLQRMEALWPIST